MQKQPKVCASCIYYIYDFGELRCEKVNKPVGANRCWPDTKPLDRCDEYERADISGTITKTE